MTARAWLLLAVHFAALAIGVHLMARAVDQNDPYTARYVFVHLVALGMGIGWVLRGAFERKRMVRLQRMLSAALAAQAQR